MEFLGRGQTPTAVVISAVSGTAGMEPPEALRGFLDALGVPGERIPVGICAQVGA